MINHLFKMAIEKAMLESITTTEYGIKSYDVIALTTDDNRLFRVAARHDVTRIEKGVFNFSVFNVYINYNTLGIDALWDGAAYIVHSWNGLPIIVESTVAYGDFTREKAIDWMKTNVLPNWNGNDWYGNNYYKC